MDMYGESTFDFPLTFQVGKDDLIRKQRTHVFPLGMLTAVLSVISIIALLHEMWSIKPKTRVKSRVSSIDHHLRN